MLSLVFLEVSQINVLVGSTDAVELDLESLINLRKDGDADPFVEFEVLNALTGTLDPDLITFDSGTGTYGTLYIQTDDETFAGTYTFEASITVGSRKDEANRFTR